jgi:hypothetical protein
MHLLLALACATTPAPEPAAEPAAEPAPASAEDPWVDLRTVSVGNQQILFRGEAVPEGLNQAFGIRELVFVLADGTTAPFKPTGTVQFSDWTFDIGSPDGRHVLLVQDHYGPYHVVAVANLVPYLAGTTGPDHVLHQAQSAEVGAWVHQGGRWNGDTEVAYEAGLTTMETFTYAVAD